MCRIAAALLLIFLAGNAASQQFFCTFARSPTDCGFREQAREGGRASLVGIARDGATGVRLRTLPGDSDVAGSGKAERNDLALSQADTDGYQGREHWWAHSVLFPDDYVAPPASTGTHWHWGVVFGFHNSAWGPGQGNFSLDAMPATAISPDRPTGLRLRGYGGAKNGDGEFSALLGPVQRNVWYDFVYHVRWSSGPDGVFDAWLRIGNDAVARRVLSHRGPTLYEGQGVYLKLANYHTAFGKPSSMIHDRVIRAAAPGDVTLVPLEGVPMLGAAEDSPLSRR